MATFEEQVEGLTSLSIDGSSAPTQTELTQFLTDGAKEVINVLPPALLNLCASSVSFTSGSASTLNTGNVLRVFRSDGDITQPCRAIDAMNKGRFSDSDDMNYATVTDPVFYIENNSLDVLPAGGSATYSEVQYPAVAYGDSAISAFPDEVEYLVVLYASMKSLQNKLGSKSSDLPSDVTLPDLPVAPAVPSISNLTISNAVPASPSLSSNSVTFSTSVPTYTKPTLAMGVAPTISDLTIGTVPPSVPSDPSFDTGAISVSSSAPTYTKPSLALASAPTISDLTIGVVPPAVPSISTISYINAFGGDASVTAVSTATASVITEADVSGNAPAYTKPSMVLSAPPTISDLNINVVPPSVPSAPSFDTGAISVSASAPTYSKPTLSLGSAPTILDLTIGVVPPSVPSLTTVSYDDASNQDASADSMVVPSEVDVSSSAPSYIKPSITSQTRWNSYWTLGDFGDSDPGSLSITTSQPTVPSINTVSYTNASGGYAGATAVSTATASSPIKASVDSNIPTFSKPVISPDFSQVNTHLDTNEDVELASVKIQEIQTQISEYNSDIQNEQAEFNKENVQYQANIQAEFNKANHDLQVAVANANNLAAEYRQEAQQTTEIDKFNKQQTQALNLANAAKQMEDLIADNSGKLQKYSSEIQSYQAKVNNEVQQYTQNLSRYSTELNTVYTAWAKTESDNIQIFQSDIQNELNVFNKENAKYQVEFKEAVEKNNQDLQVEVERFRVKTELSKFNKQQDQALNLANAAKQIEDIIADNNSKLQKYSHELQSYQLQVNKAVQEYQQNLEGDLQVWHQGRQTDIQKYSSDIQNELNEFNKEQTVFQNDLQERVQEATNQQTKDSSEYSAKLQRYSNELQSYQAQINKEVQEYQQNLDGDLRVWESERQTDLQKYASDIQNELNEFNKENARYQVELQEATQKAGNDLQVALANANNLAQEYRQEAQQSTEMDKFNKSQAQALNLENSAKQIEDAVADNGSKLQKYSAELQSYQLQVSKVVQEYQQNLEGDLQVWYQERQTDIQKYNTDIQNELNEFNKEQTVFQNELQERIQESQNQQTKDSSEYSAKLQKYSNELQSYQMQIGKDVQSYQNNLEGDLKVWLEERQTDIQKYGTDIQSELNEFNKENTVYQAQLQISIQDAQLASQDDAQLLQKYASELSSYQAQVGSSVQQYQLNLQADLEEYQQKLAKYGVELQTYQAESSAKIQNYSAKIQKHTTDYQWLHGQHQLLSADYKSGIQTLMGV